MLLTVIIAVYLGSVHCQCPDGWKPYHNSCYLFSTSSKVTWFEAASSCLSHHSDIVSVQTAEEQQFLQNVTQVLGGGNVPEFWLGGRDDAVKGTWEWAADNTVLGYTNWGPGQPDNGDNEEDCMEMKQSDNWLWNDKECDAHLHFICEMERPGFGSGIIG